MNKIPQKLVSFLKPILNALSYNPTTRQPLTDAITASVRGCLVVG